MILYSNCKINIGLNVLNRREDGFHSIETIFFPVKGLCDAIEVEKRRDDLLRFSSSGNLIDCPVEQNSCVKAYRLMKEHFDLSGISIHLHKKIPFEAGLGGGSANAAYLIKAINSLYCLNLSDSRMMEIAAKHGSDTPFFIKNRPMLGQGRGEELSEIELSLKGLYLTIVKPNVGVSTSQAYSLLKLKKHEQSIPEILKMPIDCWKEHLGNDFEEEIFKKYPLLPKIKENLYKKGALYASMSGSGSAIFSLSYKKLNFDDINESLFIYSEIL